MKGLHPPAPRGAASAACPSVACFDSGTHLLSCGKLFWKALSFFIKVTCHVHLSLLQREITSHPDVFMIKNKKSPDLVPLNSIVSAEEQREEIGSVSETPSAALPPQTDWKSALDLTCLLYLV